MRAEPDGAPKLAPSPLGVGLARALEAISESSRGLDLVASACPADSHQLSIRIEDRDGEALILFIESLRAGQPYYRQNERLGLWYFSDERWAAHRPAWIQPLVEDVARIIFSPQHQAVADELAARDATRRHRSFDPDGSGASAPGDASEPASHSEHVVGLFPGSTRHVLRWLLRPLYDRYVRELFSIYLPEEARAADSVLDAMCGRSLPNLTVIRTYFANARLVAATDIDIDTRRKAPPGTSVFRADLSEPLPAECRYQLITVFKPPTGAPRNQMRAMLAQLAAALAPGGHLFILFGTHDRVDDIEEALRRLDLSIVRSEANTHLSALEVEHVWVLIARAPR